MAYIIYVLTLVLNILLIFFVFACSEKPAAPEWTNVFDPSGAFDNIPPDAHLTSSPDTGITNETEFLFDASKSKEIEMPEAILFYRWDLNGDGIWDTMPTRDSQIKYIFGIGGGRRFVRVRILGGNNLKSETFVTVFVNTRPTIRLYHQRDIETENLIHFDASQSWDFEDLDDLQYRWDFDNDGNWNIQWTDSSKVSNLFLQNDWIVKVAIKDTENLTSEIIVP